MKFHFIGTSHGVPEKNRKCTCTMIEVSGNYYFLDMGTSANDYLVTEGLDINQVKAIFISHMHGDHTDGLIQFVDLINWHDKNCNPQIYLPDIAAAKVIDDWLRVTLCNMRTTDYREIFAGVLFDDGFLKVTAIPTKHCVNSYAYLFEAEGKKVIFTGDLCRPEVDFPELAKEIETDFICGECAHFDATKYYPYLKECNTKAFYIHHYSPKRMPSIPELASQLAPLPVLTVQDGDIIEI